MSAAPSIAKAARLLAVRLRLGLVDPAAIERWADAAILIDEGAHSELVELCLARTAKRDAVLEWLGAIGGPLQNDDLVDVMLTIDLAGLSDHKAARLGAEIEPVLGLIEDEQPARGNNLRNLLARLWRAQVEVNRRETAWAMEDIRAALAGLQEREGG